jgi:hypothetical protein
MPEGSGLTLMRLGVWTRDARLKMRLMSLMVDDCRRSRGGALVSLIHAYTENGDPFARGFTDEVLEEVRLRKLFLAGFEFYGIDLTNFSCFDLC